MKGDAVNLKFLPDYLSPVEAAEYLQCTENSIKHLIAECKLKVGLFVPGWTGEAWPAPIEGSARHWEGGINGSDEKGITDTYRCKETGETFTVRRGWISQFWYVQHSDAYKLVTSEGSSIEVTFLEPVDCAALHELSPEHFPAGELIYCLDDEQMVSRAVSWEKLLFRRIDLDTLIGSSAIADASAKPKVFRDNTLLSTIASLLLNWPGGATKAPSAKDLEKAAEASGIRISDSSIRSALDRAIELMNTADGQKFTK